MSGGTGTSKKPKAYHFHVGWEEVFFSQCHIQCVCLIRQSTIAIPIKGNVERHFRTVHKKTTLTFFQEAS